MCRLIIEIRYPCAHRLGCTYSEHAVHLPCANGRRTIPCEASRNHSVPDMTITTYTRGELCPACKAFFRGEIAYVRCETPMLPALGNRWLDPLRPADRVRADMKLKDGGLDFADKMDLRVYEDEMADRWAGTLAAPSRGKLGNPPWASTSRSDDRERGGQQEVVDGTEGGGEADVESEDGGTAMDLSE